MCALPRPMSKNRFAHVPTSISHCMSRSPEPVIESFRGCPPDCIFSWPNLTPFRAIPLQVDYRSFSSASSTGLLGALPIVPARERGLY